MKKDIKLAIATLKNMKRMIDPVRDCRWLNDFHRPFCQTSKRIARNRIQYEIDKLRAEL